MKWRYLWTAVATLALLIVISVGVNSFLFHTATDRPIEEPYWAFSQYENALLGLRGDMYAAVAGVHIPGVTIVNDIRITLSKSRLLTRPSPAQDLLLERPSFALALPHLKAFEQVMIDLADHPITNERLAPALEQIEALLPVLAETSPEIWQFQVGINERLFQESEQRVQWNQYLGIAFTFVAFAATVGFGYGALRLRDQKRQLEDHKKQLEQTLNEKTAFMGMVSHELKSPLQTIVATTESFRSSMGAGERHNAIARISRAAQSLDLQLRDLLTLARSQSGKLEYRPELFDAHALLEEIVQLEAATGYDKDLRLQLVLPSEPVLAVADSGRIAQILRNLISNAIKYTDAGEIEIGLQADEHADGLKFWVDDSGPGMPSGFVPHESSAFKRFGAIDKREGYGIGLRIAYTLTEYLGGTLRFNSSEAGTRFDLSIPATVQHEQPLPDIDRLHILLVDDTGDLLESLQDACHKNGIKADIAESAAVAANMLAATPYDAALIDINMPIRRGDELANDLRRGGMMANSKCLLLGMSATRHPDLEIKSPFDQMLEKPIRLKALLPVLQHRATSST